MKKNALEFKKNAGLKIFLDRLLKAQQITVWLKEYQENSSNEEAEKKNKSPLTESKKIRILSNILKERGYITNAKIIYKLYCLNKSLENKKDNKKNSLIYFTEQCEKVFDLLENVVKDNKNIYISEENKTIVADFCYLKKSPQGRPEGVHSKGSLKSDKQMINKFFKEAKNWNHYSHDMKKDLLSNTYSIYSFIEYKAQIGNKKAEYCTIEILRSLVKFGKGAKGDILVIYVKNELNKIVEYEVGYNITPISAVKMAIKTDDIHLNLLGDPLVSFFFEVTNQNFNDFALGYFRETNINNGFKIGTSILVKEIKDTKEEREISQKQVISYNNLQDLPIESLKLFFLNRNLNFLRPPVVNSQKFIDLENKIKKISNKPKDTRMYKYDIFISMPILFDNPNVETYNTRISYYETLKKILPNRKIYFAAAGKSFEQYKLEIMNRTFDKVIEEIPNALNFIVLIPPFEIESKEKVSKSLLEIGIAKHLRRNILSLVHIESTNYLPNSTQININQMVFNSLEDFEKLEIEQMLH